MSKFEDFKTGDRVEHSFFGPGLVVEVAELLGGTPAVCVLYDRQGTTDGSRNDKRTFCYDANWFGHHGDMLTKTGGAS